MSFASVMGLEGAVSVAWGGAGKDIPKGAASAARGRCVDVGVVSRMFWAPCSAKAQVSGLACSAEAGRGSAPVLRGALFCQVWNGACSVCPGCPGVPVLRKGPGGEPPAVTILWMSGRPDPLGRSPPGVRGRRPSNGGRP